MKKFVYLLIVLIAACNGLNTNSPQMIEGEWHAKLEVMDGYDLPFTFDLRREHGQTLLEVKNAQEQILVDEISTTADSFHIQMPVFEGYLAGTFTDSSMTGEFIKESLDRYVPFYAALSEQDRFPVKRKPNRDVSGIWETTFNPGTADEDIAKGIFTQTGSKLTGTYRTPTGDYRYLEGVMDGDSLKLSTFDGAHAFLFVARVTDSLMEGAFYSGNHSKELFVAKPNPDFELPDANSLTYIKEGYNGIAFSFPNEEGNLISLADPTYKDKAVLLQIMGTWCPNCLDESKFLSGYMNTYEYTDLEVIALAFEYAPTKEQAFKAIKRLRDKLSINYPILLAQYGTSNKAKANEKLPMLNHVLSYPTTIFIDKKGVVRNIHTGFNGPATGAKFEEFKVEFDSLIQVIRNQ
ncbi:MAG: TlpA family protein disulfide reductase [Flavobacteriaceae bacterium]|nr:TlpA family protein disulfide reductase [Flavobacteriaceae bacterium]